MKQFCSLHLINLALLQPLGDTILLEHNAPYPCKSPDGITCQSLLAYYSGSLQVATKNQPTHCECISQWGLALGQNSQSSIGPL